MTGDQEELSKSMKDMIFSLILSVIFVYLVLVTQFKSFIHPITIMSAIPLVIIGVAPALGLSGKYIHAPIIGIHSMLFYSYAPLRIGISTRC
ncbi:efflux RND transporter permease subunit [Tissierella praeacuta]|uniref:efflux RND transporter permease subunit n=1 Tax=Tissierella praeacuta TaxID=43131 RepID=UPI001043CBFA|nr:efflux RND transporter permease subunit [Tissierella praeacuta]